MSAEIARVSKENFCKEDIDSILRAAEIIKTGGTVVFPTETVYGLGANALSEDAAKKIYAAKGRPSDNPLIVHISSKEMLVDIVSEIDDVAKKLIDEFWPGPITFIFKKKDIVPLTTTGGLDTVAVRMPDHKVALKLIEEAGLPIAGPSANISGRPSITSSKYALEEMSERVDMIILSDDSEIGIESTVVDLTVEIPLVLRPGKISQREILEIAAAGNQEKLEELNDKLKRIMEEKNANSKDIIENEKRAPKSPGMKYRHYSPKAEVLVAQNSEEILDFVSEYQNKIDEAGKRIYLDDQIKVFCLEENKALYGDFAFSLGKDSIELAKSIFTSLRLMDDMGVKLIICECFSFDELSCAVMNRLVKASANI